ncbi:hypothetical protein ATO13_07245 [Stappia sp. 22II-S9-Z10]|nr:hypothetical protein ATO13_07245 [Stappia sp. 22II-S9-Z10]
MRVPAIAVAIAMSFAAPAVYAQTGTPPSTEDNFTPEHLALAQDVVDATQSAATFDDILPRVAQQLQGIFTRSNPAIAPQVEEVVYEVALEFASRRVELARTIQLVWARRFTVEELQELKDFFTSGTGQKFVELTPSITALSVGAARQWEQELSQQMLDEARNRLVASGAL